MSTKGSVFWDQGDGINTPDWHVDARKCPFDELPIRFCGCPEGERLLEAERLADEAHLIRGED